MQAQVSALQVEIETKQETLAAGPTPMELAELAALSGGRLHAHWGARQQRRGGMMGILSRSANKSPAVRYGCTVGQHYVAGRGCRGCSMCLVNLGLPYQLGIKGRTLIHGPMQ